MRPVQDQPADTYSHTLGGCWHGLMAGRSGCIAGCLALQGCPSQRRVAPICRALLESSAGMGAVLLVLSTLGYWP